MTIEEWLDQWIEDRTEVRQTTRDTNRSHLPHIKDRIGHLRIGQPSWPEIETMYRDLKKEFANSTVRNIATTLSAAMTEAVRQGHIEENPCSDAELPKREPSSFNVLSENEAAALRDELKTYSAYDTAIYLALDTGMRKSEILGLFWDNVDLQKGLISVVDTCVETSTGREFGDPKTPASRRSISISDYTCEVLAEYRARQDEYKAQADSWTYPGLVITTHDGNPLNTRSLSGRFNKRKEDAGVTDITFHELRHTHATILLKKDTHPKVVQERLGHSSIKTTMDKYSHVSRTMQDEVAEDFSSIYEEDEDEDGLSENEEDS